MISSKSSGSTSKMIERTAIETSGCVGSLYDGSEDCILTQVEIGRKRSLHKSEKSTRCKLIYGYTETRDNVLRMFGIESQLRLSILLTSTSRSNLAALLDHPDPLNEYTRFLHYTYIDRTEELSTSTEFSNLLELLNNSPGATHVITSVSWGINFVAVLQLSSDVKAAARIEDKLQRIQAMLNRYQSDTRFSWEDEVLFEKKVKTKVYSNIPVLREITSIFAICQYINSHSNQFDLYRPVKYGLRPIKDIYTRYRGPEIDFSALHSSSMEDLEQNLIELFNRMKKLKYSFGYIKSALLCEHLKDELVLVEREWAYCNKAYKEIVKHIQQLVIDVRLKSSSISQIDQILADRPRAVLTERLDQLISKVNGLKMKGLFIADLLKEHFEYRNIATLDLTKENYIQTLPNLLTTRDQKQNRILCSADILNKKNQSELNDLIDQLCKEREQNPQLNLIYADFSYCSFELRDLTILPSTKTHASDVRTSPQRTSPETEDDVMNILLLGESGVGKSTFINAFINYLVFDTLRFAESKQPVVLIPISFLVTTGDSFEERILKFGTSDDLNNENFDFPGGSATQHCKSYVFRLKHHKGKQLRIIDTPGFGDTRGFDQDNRNMEHILKCISNLTHLTAVCFLLKPNVAQLNSYFRTCLTQLFDLLGPDALQNVVFCFTNTRSTFYSPGDTVPPLRALLQSFSFGNIPFEKKNVFCFDNAAFRYLVTLKNSLPCQDLDRNEYERSWAISQKESNQLVNYIISLKTYFLHNKRQSTTNAQIEITYMIRPMLETMRNIMRHVIMSHSNILNKSIRLKPKAIRRPASKCLLCAFETIWIDHFLIAKDDLHEMVGRCRHCRCSPNEHCSIDYELQYELLHQSIGYDRNQMGDIIQKLLIASHEFAYFLLHVVRSTESDPFSFGIRRMIEEESRLSQMENSGYLNSKLMENLRRFHKSYEYHMKKANSNERHIDLKSIYKRIEEVRTQPEVQKQLAAVEESRRKLLKKYEYVVPENLIP